MIGVKGIMLWPFIIVRNKKDLILVNHERIHYYQANELWVIKFYWLYFKYYFRNRRGFKGNPSVKHQWAYRNIPFEIEAFSSQSNLDYLKNRKKLDLDRYR
jgi:hypothetical protein